MSMVWCEGWRACRSLVASVAAVGVCACAVAGELGGDDSGGFGPVPDDAGLFEVALREAMSWEGVPKLLVDPRPLRPDPALVTLSDFGAVVPEWVSREASANALADSPPAVLEARLAVLEQLGLDRGDAWTDIKCPGVLVPPSPTSDALKEERCPREHRTTIIVALPRQGGPYWPANMDERDNYTGRTVYSVRVIARSASPRGAYEASEDLVVECSTATSCMVVETRPLMHLH